MLLVLSITKIPTTAAPPALAPAPAAILRTITTETHVRSVSYSHTALQSHAMLRLDRSCTDVLLQLESVSHESGLCALIQPTGPQDYNAYPACMYKNPRGKRLPLLLFLLCVE